MEGPEEFNVALRAQLNHHENLVSFLPALWLAAVATKNDKIVGGAGLAWVAARAMFSFGYTSGTFEHNTALLCNVISYIYSIMLIVLCNK